MDIRQLRYFIMVAEHLNFTEAANALYMTQSNVSRQIAALENELGLKLFNRTKHSVQLTATGIVFLKEARAVLLKTEEAIQKTRETASGLVGSLKIGFIGSAVKSFLPEFINYFHKKYSKIELELVQSNWEHLNQCMAAGDLDICFTLDLDLRNAPGLNKKKIYTDSVAIVSRCDHPLAQTTHIDFQNLAHESFIYFDRQTSSGGMDIVFRICENRGFTPNIVYQVSLMETILSLVEAGLGISILPRFAETYKNSSLSFINLDGPDSLIDIVVTWRKINFNPSVPLFIEEFEKKALPV